MDIIAPNTVKVNAPDEQIYELIKLIKHKYDNTCHFLRGPLWRTAKRTYSEKLINCRFHLVNHHIYELQENGSAKVTKSYWKVSGRGNINLITREEAIEVIDKRTDYVEDIDLLDLGPDDDPSVPYYGNCDW